MSSRLSPYPSLVPVRSTLFRTQPDAVPPTDELENLHEELKNLRQRTLERARKAGEDLRAIEESMRRMKEREKGKAKAIDKVKREQDFTQALDSDDPKANALSYPASKRTALPVASSASSSSRLSSDPRKTAGDDSKKKKKKRKRDVDDSDVELERPRKTTPPQHTHPPPKATKPTPFSAFSHSNPPIAPDWTIPPPYQLLPPRPAVPRPPSPGPSKPSEVQEDFSKLKHPSQITINTFYASIEPWIRPIKEEDVGFLEFTADEVEPYAMPKLGRPYSEVWEEEDTALYGGPMPGFTPTRVPGGQGATSVPTPKWDPSTLVEPDLVTEEKGHGPLTERLISALLPIPDLTVWKGVKAAEDAMEGRPGGSGAAAARREKVNVSDLEDRIRDTMRFYGLLDRTVPNYSEKVDDPIATALRHAQKELRTVVATNKARKARLTAVARDRLGYQEYLDLRDTVDKNIWSTYTKLQKKDVPKLGKKRKKAPDVNGNANGGLISGIPTPSPAALGFNADDDCKIGVADSLKQLVETRRRWVDVVGSVFEEKQRENLGRIWGLPKESIYQELEEDIKRELERPILEIPSIVPEPRTNGKGKGIVRGDEMDVG